ncbi:WavE lipopolysaccharide synthesis family protein [Pseudomonas sp. RIT623]|uniref:WavE lipopolysaccharide synthesis family protein n=1 Tax=Pseudomonas sp. RIT623 TaxID=2559075 RepID=UPI00106F1C6D|nr:WavE lipopolysaccharide synthesis family protein [Pseudomonas sp. RIT623]TFF33874.1 hypothetical protein E3U47_24490 [Pseudomonas sp. RIT623]
MSAKVPSKDISVVIQGPLSSALDGANATVQSIRKFLPYAEIIVSTWEGEDTSDLSSIDHLIVTKQPAPLVEPLGNVNNVARQMVSTLTGIQRSTRPFVLKMRADHILLNDNICIRPELTSKHETLAFLSRKIVVTSLFLRNHLKIPFLFHISDLVQFGTKEDMASFWGGDLPDVASLLQGNRSTRVRVFGNFSGNTSFRETPEQTLVRLWLAKEGMNISLSYPCDTSYELFSLWEKVLVENFQLLDYSSAGIVYPPRFLSAFLGPGTVLTAHEFQVMQRDPGSRRRYLKVLFSKYIKCWGMPRYWIATANVILSGLTPALAAKIRIWLRSKLGLTHPDRR